MCKNVPYNSRWQKIKLCYLTDNHLDNIIQYRNREFDRVMNKMSSIYNRGDFDLLEGVEEKLNGFLEKTSIYLQEKVRRSQLKVKLPPTTIIKLKDYKQYTVGNFEVVINENSVSILDMNNVIAEIFINKHTNKMLEVCLKNLGETRFVILD